MLSSSDVFSPADPRRWLLADVRGEQWRDRQITRQLRSTLLEDPYQGAVKALRWCRDAYNDRHCMHCVLDMAAFGSKGQLWLGGVAASSDAGLLEESNVKFIWPANFERTLSNDPRFQVLPVTDGTGVMAGDLPLEPILARVSEICLKVLEGFGGLLVCCHNGAHRSSLIMMLILMFMTGRRPGDIATYLQAIRNIVDVWSCPPRRPGLYALDFCNKVYEKVCQSRIALKFPLLKLNDVFNKEQYWAFAGSLGMKMPQQPPSLTEKSAGGRRPGESEGESSRRGRRRSKSPALRLREAPQKGQKGVRLTPAPEAGRAAEGAAEAVGTTAKSSGQAPSFPKAPPAVVAAAKPAAAVPEAAASTSMKAEAEAKVASEPPAAKGPAAAEAADAAREPPAAAPEAASEAVGAAETKKETVESAEELVREQPAKVAKKEEQRDVKEVSSQSGSAEMVRDILLSLSAMRKQMRDLVLHGRQGAEAPSSSDDVDWGDEEDKLPALQLAEPELVQLLLEEQKKLTQRVEELVLQQGKIAEAEAVADRVEGLWSALREKNLAVSESEIENMPAETLDSMRDTAGMTPLHIVARERWYGPTCLLLAKCPGMANRVSYECSPPRWTALMSLSNMPKAKDRGEEKRESEIAMMLVAAMSVDALNTQSGIVVRARRTWRSARATWRRAESFSGSSTSAAERR